MFIITYVAVNDSFAQPQPVQVGAITRAERGSNTTGVYYENAAWSNIPPMSIFKRKRLHSGLEQGAPTNTLFACTDSGWIESDTFVLNQICQTDKGPSPAYVTNISTFCLICYLLPVISSC